MSQPKQYEAATIEEALRAVAIDLGDDVEIVSAVKERRGGVLGFFAKERFVVTAQPPSAEVVDQDSAAAFGELLLSLTDGVEDTWEGTTPIETPAPADPDHASVPSETLAVETTATSVIDLRSGKRTQRLEPATTPDASFSFGSERPSQLRRRIRANDLAEPRPLAPSTPVSHIDHDDPNGTEAERDAATVLTVAGPLHGLGDTAPNWSLASLRDLGLPVVLLETVQEFDPTSDIEWMHAIAIAIDRMWPEDTESIPVSWVVGEGRAAAVELIRGIPFGRLPAAIILPGRKIRATSDELALALRECVR